LLEDISPLNILDERIIVGDTRIGDNVVEVINALVDSLLDGVEGRLLDAGIILDHENTAAFAGGELGEFLGG
jgi:hypothetical protein